MNHKSPTVHVPAYSSNISKEMDMKGREEIKSSLTTASNSLITIFLNLVPKELPQL